MLLRPVTPIGNGVCYELRRPGSRTTLKVHLLRKPETRYRGKDGYLPVQLNVEHISARGLAVAIARRLSSGSEYVIRKWLS